ncbi:MAG: UDP-N-acetylglucosamine 2-epimerase (hydrolyzing) [Nanoarchaeota archaeon]|nr:UDP-N-acetylglucosamine 2-epimerase (hydrolyzing) [Nanoarchaeota archaeon]
MRKIALISDARTSHGIYTPILRGIEKNPNLDYIYIITGMHLSKKFGETINVIKEEGFKTIEMKLLPKRNKKSDQVKFIGKAISKLIDIFEKEKPDIILAQGDRGISLAATIVGAYMLIPVAHMHGGEVSGTIDESTRHAISKYSHIHFPATKKSAERISKLGEDNWRIHLVGATGIEYILNQKLMSKEETASIFGFDPKKTIIVVLQHPVTKETKDSRNHMKETMDAIEELKEQTIVIYPNSDAGNDEIIEVIEETIKKNKDKFFIKSYKNLSFDRYLNLLKHSGVLVGNSSGGIIETPSLGLPVVNIGTRQEGREKAENLIDVGYNKNEIICAIKKALYDEKFKSIVAKKETPYNPCKDGKVSKRILDVLEKIEVNERLLDKKITY